MQFEMKVVGIFNLSSGYTIFVGPVSGEKSRIKCGTKAQVLVDNTLLKVVELHGEWIADKKYPLDYRSLSTLSKVDISSDFIKEHNCILRGIGNCGEKIPQL